MVGTVPSAHGMLIGTSTAGRIRAAGAGRAATCFSIRVAFALLYLRRCFSGYKAHALPGAIIQHGGIDDFSSRMKGLAPSAGARHRNTSSMPAASDAMHARASALCRNFCITRAAR